LLELAADGGVATDRDWAAVANDDAVSTEDAMRALIDGMARRNARIPRPLLARSIVELMRLANDWRMIRGERPDLPATLAALIARGQARGEVEADAGPAEVGGILSMLTLQAMLTWAATGREPLADVLWRRVSLVLRGVMRR